MVRALQELLDARKKRLKRTVRKAAREGETAPVGTALDSVPLKIDETFWQREDRIRLVTGALEGARVENSEQRASISTQRQRAKCPRTSGATSARRTGSSCLLALAPWLHTAI